MKTIMRLRYQLGTGLQGLVRTTLGVVLFFGAITNTMAITCAINTAAGEYGASFEDTMGNQRYYLYKIPVNYDPATPGGFPIVFVFHGGGSSALIFADSEGQLRMRALADERDFILVYPQGNLLVPPVAATCPADSLSFIPQLWQAPTTQINSPDVQFVEELYTYLADPVTGLNVDSNRVYAVGYSNGGMLAHRLGGERADRFTAIATVSSTAGARFHIIDAGPPVAIDYWTVPLVPPNPTQVPMPVMMIHNKQDDVVPFDGGPGNIFVNLVEYISNQESWDHWYEANSCSVKMSTIQLPPIVVTGGFNGWRTSNLCKSTYTTAPLVKIIFDDLQGGSHHWPNLVEDNFDASEAIVDFLLSFSK